jgi:hypothetical protein
MKENYRSLRKPWRIFSSIISAIIIVTFIAPFSTHTAFALDVPQPIYPNDNASTTPVTDPPLGVPSFSWSNVSGANVYRLQVDSEIGFNQPIFLDITTRNTSFTPSSSGNLFSDGQWYWRVRVEDPTPVGNWSNPYVFHKTWATPENKPTLLAPADGASLAFFDSPAFSWTPVIGAARYRFQIATTPDGWDSPLLSEDILSTSHQPTNRYSNGLYYWRVVPMDVSDHLGTPSNVQSFTAAYGTQPMNMVPMLISPQDYSFPTFTPTFHWSAVEGAQQYRLEYTSDDKCNFSVGTSLTTRQTFYTPTDTFSNDFGYCWHVRVESGPAVGDWSQTWHFQKIWSLKPILLTPTNLYQTGLYPMYSWTPVPGASRYHIEIAENPSFNPLLEDAITANTTYTPQSRYDGTAHYWWRVTPIDGGGKFGGVSDVSEYQSIYNSEAPIQIYPLYYYQPNNYPGFPMNPYEDRTVAFPIFMWHRVMVPAPNGGVYASAYRIQVDATPYFSTPLWEYDTENSSATPTSADDFIPTVGQDYFWRVCPLDGLGGNCLTNPDTGAEWWSQIWKTRFDSSLELQPTNGQSPELLRPAMGQDSVEATPLLEWWPLLDAAQYQVEISRDENFSSLEISETVNIPAYSPVVSLAERRLGRTDYGTFYWRVRGLAGAGQTDWSSIWRFQIASQSEWRYSRNIGDAQNQLLIGSDPTGDTSPGYDLSTLYASQSNTSWFLGFNVDISTTNITYVFYIDLDNVDSSGANVPPPDRNYNVSTIPAHQPEFAVYVDEKGGMFNTSNTWVYAWNGNSWGYGQKFYDIGGAVYASSGYVELQIPNSAIGMNQDTSSASIMLFSVNLSTNQLLDTVPSDPEVPGNAILSRFTAVSEHMNLVYPPTTTTGDPTTLTSLLPFYWDWPTGSNGATPFAGIILQVDLDQKYTPPHEAVFQINSDTSYFCENNASLLNDIMGDNTYYWRIQPRYMTNGFPDAYGAWTGGWSFHRIGFTTQNLSTSVTFATPTFKWDMAEGADSYRLQVSTDPNFGSTAINITTPMNTYTPPDTLAQGLYYWRVQVIRNGGTANDWSEVQQFNLSLPTPTGLTPDNQIVHSAPAFCWDPLVGYDHGEAVLTAWRYRLQVSKDPTFSSIYDSSDTYNNCWTPAMGYDDGTYYWHVAMYDGNGRTGSYSPSATFTKQYPITTLISPISGVVPRTPTFIWTPVDGAARYEFEVSWYPTFYPLYDSIETMNTQYTPTFIYQSDKAYYWRVAIRDHDGRQGPFTDAYILIGAKNKIFLALINR